MSTRAGRMVIIDNMWGYINKSGRMVIEPQFRDAYPFTEGLATVAISGIPIPRDISTRQGRWLSNPSMRRHGHSQKGWQKSHYLEIAGKQESW